MNDPQIRVKRDEEYSLRGSVKYVCEVWHKGLNDYRCLTSSDEDVLENKVEAHIIKLKEKWSIYQQRRNLSNSKEANIREGEQRAKSAKEDLQAIEDLLIFTLEIDDAINWNSLFDRTPYEHLDPLNYLRNRINKVPKPVNEPFQILAEIPNRLHEKYNPKLDWVEKLIPYFAKDKITKAEASYTRDITSWQEITKNAKRTNERIDQTYAKKSSVFNKVCQFMIY